MNKVVSDRLYVEKSLFHFDKKKGGGGTVIFINLIRRNKHMHLKIAFTAASSSQMV